MRNLLTATVFLFGAATAKAGLRLLLLITLTIPLGLALAETINLVCSHENGFSFNVIIDTSARSVVVGGKPARDVLLDADAISFTIDMEDGPYFHDINRSTGSLFVKAPSGSIIYGHRCERAKPKF